MRFSSTHGKFDGLQKEQEAAFWKAYNNDAYQSLVSPGGDLTVEAGTSSLSGQIIVASQGDTLQSIAARVYGTPDAWYRLADANNLDFDSVLVAGQTVLAPGATASAEVLDFDLEKLVGSTAPNLPPPPPDQQNCIMLVIVAVAVVVAAVIAPTMLTAAASMVGGGATMATASTAGLMVAGAMTGAVANVASQAVAVAAGVQDKFDWKNVGMAAVGGAVGAGFGAVAPNAFVSAAASSVVNEGLAVMTGMQEKFSWATVAGAAAGAGIESAMSNGEFGARLAGNNVTGQFRQGFVRGGLAGLAGSLVTDLLTPGKQSWAQIGIGAVSGGFAAALAQQRDYDDGRDDALMSGQAERGRMGELKTGLSTSSELTSVVPDELVTGIRWDELSTTLSGDVWSSESNLLGDLRPFEGNVERPFNTDQQGGFVGDDGTSEIPGPPINTFLRQNSYRKVAATGQATPPSLSNSSSADLFGPSGVPSPHGIVQGGAGDCYFAATLIATADQQPSLLRNLIADGANGTYTVNWNWSETRAVTNIFRGQFRFDDNGNTVMGMPATKQHGIFAAVLEHAAALQFGSDFITGGHGISSMALITGRTDIMHYGTPNNTPSWDGSGFTHGATINAEGFKFDPSREDYLPDLQSLKREYDFEQLYADFRNGAIATAATPPNAFDISGGRLVPSHMYAITNVQKGIINTVEVTNPWPDGAPFSPQIGGVPSSVGTPMRRVVVLPATAFFSNFQYLTVAR